MRRRDVAKNFWKKWWGSTIRCFSSAIGRARYDWGMRELRRITIDPAVMGGKPCIRGMRVTVGMIVESIAAGRTIPELLTDFPYLKEEDIREALSYAATLAPGAGSSLGQLMRILMDMNLTPRWVHAPAVT